MLEEAIRTEVEDVGGRLHGLTITDGLTGNESVLRMRPSQADGKLGIFYTFAPSPKRLDPARLTPEEFKRWVERLVSSGKMRLPKPYFDWEGEELRYRLPLAFEPEIEGDPYEAPLSAQLTVQAIRAYRMRSAGQRAFWGPVLAKVEQRVAIMLKDIQTGHKERLEERLAEIRRIYEEELNRLARNEGKRGAMIPAEDYRLYLISVNTVPDGGEIRFAGST